jgi:hypothetical protein
MILRIKGTNLIGECMTLEDVNGFITSSALELGCERIHLYSSLVFETSTSIDFVRPILAYEDELLKKLESVESRINIRQAVNRVNSTYELDLTWVGINKGKRIRFSFSLPKEEHTKFSRDLAMLCADVDYNSSDKGQDLVNKLYSDLPIKFYNKYIRS